TGPQFQQRLAAFHRGDLAAARAATARMLDSFAFINTDDSVFSMSIKAMLRSLGHAVGECRLPLPPTPPGVQAQAHRVWQALQPA
ncbi:MAG: 4-hydroxy-tetrahydrodipicolinate synthase, partial [Ramlibacter sp.]